MATYTKQKHISEDTRFLLPKTLRRVDYDGRIIVIASETARWIVLTNEHQYHFFKLLNEFIIGDALSRYMGTMDDARYVVTQIVAKDFCNTKVHHKHNTHNMQFYLTQGCNMRCPHCYMYAGTKEEDELTTEEVKRVLETFRANSGDVVVFSGGEIGLRKDLEEIVGYSFSIGLKNELLTNGTLWTDGMISRLSPMVSRVQISIDGFSEETNARIRGAHNFAKALQTVEKFYNHNVYTEVSVTPYLDSELAADYMQYAEFAKSLNGRFPGPKFIVKFAYDILDGREIMVDEKKKNAYQSIISKINHKLYGMSVDQPFIEFHKKGGIEDNCDYGSCAVSATGDISLCPVIPEMKPIGNVRKDNLAELFSFANEMRKLSDVNNLSPCKDCELKYICGGDCRIRHFEGFKECDPAMIKRSYRICSKEKKEEFYDLMIRVNEKLYQ